MLLVFLAAGALYAVSLAPGVFWGDSAEFQRRAATLDLSPIARGYPLHRVLTWLAGRFVGDPALGGNLISAIFGAVSAALAHEAGRRLSGSRTAGFASAAALALCPTFWLYAGVAEVYTLHAAILLALLLAVREAPHARGARLAFGALVGISFLHHRMTAFALPGLAVYLWIALRRAPAAVCALRRAADIAVGLAAGLLPFVVLCFAASRSPPPGADGGLAWWFNDVFLGGDQNAQHLLGSGSKSVVQNLAYVTKWIVYDLAGPALVLAAWGFVRAARRDAADAWMFGVLLLLHLVFPFRYDWTGDQFSFLIPFFVTAAPLVAEGAAGVRERWGRGAERAAVAGTVAVPAALALVLAFTPLGARLVPGLAPEARRLLVLPIRAGDDRPGATCRARLGALPAGVRLHADWGDGQVYLYLQAVERLRTDVEVSIWYGRGPALLRDGRDEWVSAMPGALAVPDAIRSLGDAVEPRTEGLWQARR